MRAWWAENGSYVMGGIAVGIIVIFGWNRWQSSMADTEVAASTLFEEVMEAAALNLSDNAEGPAASLFSNYPDTPYAAQARLAMARLYMDSGRDQDAADVLRPLTELPPDNELSLVGRLRMTQILLYQEKPQAVIDLVKDLPETGFSARYNEALGDAYFMLGQYSEAETAYLAALNDNPLAPTIDRTLLQLKINDLPAPDQGEAADAMDAVIDAAEEAPAADASGDPEAPAEVTGETSGDAVTEGPAEPEAE